jgi:hypothetical protein
MADTGSPWNLSYPLATDLVRDGAAAIQQLAEDTANGLDDLDTAVQAAGGLVAVKHAIFTGTQSNSTAASANFAVTNLSITHTMASASNKLIISAYFGAAANTAQRGDVGIGVADNGTLVAIGAAVGSRTRVGAGGQVSVNVSSSVVTMPSIQFVHEPGDVASHTYTVRAINIRSDTRTIHINRDENDNNSADRPRTASALVIQEVKV